MEITNVQIDVIENTKAVLFNIDDCDTLQCEWIKLSFNEDKYITEKTDSHLKSHSDTSYDVDDVLSCLDEILESIGIDE